MKKYSKADNGEEGHNATGMTFRAKLPGIGIHRVALESAASGRFKVPAAYFNSEEGFGCLMEEEWMVTFLKKGSLVAMPRSVWGRAGEGVRPYMDAAKHLDDKGFWLMHVEPSCRLHRSSNNRWSIPKDLLEHIDTNHAKVMVLRPGLSFIVITGLADYKREWDSAESKKPDPSKPSCGGPTSTGSSQGQ